MTLGSLNTTVTYAETVRDLRAELDKWNAQSTYIPSARDAHIEGPKVEVLIAVRGQSIPMNCERFDSVEQNIRAIYFAIRNLRLMDQRGIPMSMIADAARKLALPAPDDPYRVLGVTPGAGIDECRRAYRARAQETHPDHGGSTEDFQRVQAAAKALGISA